MKHIFDISLSFILASVLVCTACVQAEGDRSVSIVPWPWSIECSDRVAAVEPKIYCGDNSLTSLSKVLNENIYRITDFRCKVVSSRPGSGIIFESAPDMKPGAYSLTVESKKCVLRAGSYQGFVHGTASLLQILKATDGMLVLPEVDIKDEGDYPFRSVLLDLARFWQPVHTIKETVDLAYIYKLNHIHLHLSDDQSFTFPSKAFPRLKSYFPDGRRRHYTLEELKEVVEYARVRGIVVIPESMSQVTQAVLPGGCRNCSALSILKREKPEAPASSIWQAKKPMNRWTFCSAKFAMYSPPALTCISVPMRSHRDT